MTAEAELESLLPTVEIQGFSIPGVTPNTGAGGDPVNTPEIRGSLYPYDQLAKPEQWYGPAGRLLMRTYPIVESDSGPKMLNIGPNPNLHFYGRA